jgi:hypothetical protein
MSIKPTAIYPLALGANQAIRLLVAGEFFKILAATGSVTVVAEWGRLAGLNAGQGLEDSPFSYLTITDASGAPNNVSVLVGDRRFVDGMSGNVAVTATKRATTPQLAPTNPALGLASSIALAANLNRQALVIQNRDTVANCYVRCDGANATIATGFLIPPGGVWEPDTIPTAAITFIGDAASANILVLEG